MRGMDKAKGLSIFFAHAISRLDPFDEAFNGF